jgi:hypothetical protein
MRIKRIIILFIVFVSGFNVMAAENNIKWLTVSQEPNITVNGLAWFKDNNGMYYRLPVRRQKDIPSPTWCLSKCPSGARVRFKTDSTQLKLRINHGMDDQSRLVMWHMGAVAVINSVNNYPEKLKVDNSKITSLCCFDNFGHINT